MCRDGRSLHRNIKLELLLEFYFTLKTDLFYRNIMYNNKKEILGTFPINKHPV